MKKALIIIGTILLVTVIYFMTGQRTEIIMPTDYKGNYVMVVLNHEQSEKLDWGLRKRTIKLNNDGLFLTSTEKINLDDVLFLDEKGNEFWNMDSVDFKLNDFNCFMTNNEIADEKGKAITWYLKNKIPTDSLGNFNLYKLTLICK